MSRQNHPPGQGRRPFLAFALIAALSVAGCSGDSGRPHEAEVLPPPTQNAPGLWIHGPSGLPLPVDAYPGIPPVFEQHTVARTNAYEPTVAVASNGVAYTAAYPYTPMVFDSLQQVSLLRSHDLGVSWFDVTPQMVGRDALPLALDPIVWVDPATDRFFFVHTYAACMEVLWSDDEGESWQRNPASCLAPFNDHQSFFTGPATVQATTGYPSVLYLCSNQSWTIKIQTQTCIHSLDGGTTWRPPSNLPTAPIAENAPDSCVTDWYAHGHGFASPAADGTAFLPYHWCGKAYIKVSRDNGQTWEDIVVDSELGTTGLYAYEHEARVAVDSAGNAYYLWVAADGLPYLSISRDAGATWNKPINVAAPNVTVANYISIVAGDEGRIAAVYQGTNATGGLSASGADRDRSEWHVVITMSLNALDPEPVFASTTANNLNEPNRRAWCDWNTDTCGSQADYAGSAVDPTTGRVWTVFGDSCTGECAREGAPSPLTGENTPSVSVQIAGTPLRAGPDLRLAEPPEHPARGPYSLNPSGHGGGDGAG